MAFALAVGTCLRTTQPTVGDNQAHAAAPYLNAPPGKIRNSTALAVSMRRSRLSSADKPNNNKNRPQ